MGSFSPLKTYSTSKCTRRAARRLRVASAERINFLVIRIPSHTRTINSACLTYTSYVSMREKVRKKDLMVATLLHTCVVYVLPTYLRIEYRHVVVCASVPHKKGAKNE